MRPLARKTARCFAFFAALAVGASSCTRIITKGAFWGMQIGDSKPVVIGQMQRLGVKQILPYAVPQIVATTPEGLSRLRAADAVILFPGHARVTFSGNQVQDREVLPSVKPVWKARLESATTREEVFAVFAEILEQDKRAAVGTDAPDARWINPALLSESDRQLLEKYDGWEIAHDNAEGFWNVRLEFSAGQLTKFNVWHSPIDVP